ncbi:MAG TPA: hypothetical protein VGB14_01530 [Acidimicrobiales bacterium]
MPSPERARRFLGPAVAVLVAAQLLALGAWSSFAPPADLAAGDRPAPRPPLTAPPATDAAPPSTTATTAPPAPSTTAAAPPTTVRRPTTTAIAAPTTVAPPATTAPLPTVPTTDPPATGPMALGSVDATGPAGGGCPAGSTCWRATVSCPEVPAAEATVAVHPADGATRGVLVLFSGGRGDNWWEDGHVAGSGAGAPVVAELARGGLETVQVRWSGGFSATPEGSSPGFARLACRSATAVAWLRAWRYEPVAGGPAGGGPCGFCVSGNSGGASQAAWALTHFGLDPLVDGLLLTSGPPHAAIDKGCLRRPGESAYWYDEGTAVDFDRTYGAGRSGNGPCAGHDGGSAARFRRDGIATGGADYAWGATAVTFLLGDADPTVAPAHARDLADRLGAAGTPATVRVVAGMGHEVVASPAGRAAFVGVVLGRL